MSNARDIISAIDHFHGNELKDRSEASVAEEVKVIEGMLEFPRTTFVCLYTHKHGIDVGVYRSRLAAEDAAYELAHNRALEEDRWDEEQQAEFQAFEDIADAIAFFNDVEQEWSYSEFLEILERPLG